jgi:hypothetical protein
VIRRVLAVGAWAAGAGAAAGQAGPAGQALIFSEDFESYHAGTFPCTGAGCIGGGAWGLWYYMYNPGPQPGAIVDNGPAHSGTRALRMAPRSDIIKSGHLGSGRWRIRAQTWFPVSVTTPGEDGYFILLNECNLTPPIKFSKLVLFEAGSGMVKVISEPEGLPMTRGAWASLRMDVDLDANLADIYYNEQPLALGVVYAPEGEPAIQGVAMYSDGVDGMFFDTVSVEPIGEPHLCWANCDRSTQAPVLNVGDFTCFLQRFARGNLYANCDASTTAPILNVGDFTCFLTQFAQGCP